MTIKQFVCREVKLFGKNRFEEKMIDTETGSAGAYSGRNRVPASLLGAGKRAMLPDNRSTLLSRQTPRAARRRRIAASSINMP